MGTKTPDYGERWQGLEVSKLHCVLEDLFIFILCVWVFCLHVGLCTVCMQYSLRPEEDTGSLGLQ